MLFVDPIITYTTVGEVGDTVTTTETEVEEDPPTSPGQQTLSLGYAWKALSKCLTETIGKRAEKILEQAFLRGVAKGGDRHSCFQMEETLANRLPVEERVSRYRIQSWLSSRLTKQKQNSDPKFVHKRAVEACRKRLVVKEWGFDPESMTKPQIIETLEKKHRLLPRTRDNPTGCFIKSNSKVVIVKVLQKQQQGEGRVMVM